ncbi:MULTISPECIES: hypothetical protein [Fructobacillus]|uniref:hypothetical protein n=1 Tax=Fructobacillus TaxID=559173 RepID=UPI00064E0C0F|nr:MULTISPECIES: hypothetical protein [Fructobacillus]KMK52935.1 hypothetical protein FEFB_13510 [Fructobacillus sp. EFB-N1]MCK8628158.1 hypothetical protein [Fructobacillus cardui]
MTDTPIVQYPDANGNRAYVKTHVKAVDGLDDKLAIFAKTTDLTTAISQIPKVDLSGYAKTSELDKYATKDDLQKVDNEITTLKSPDGSVWFLSVDNNGRLSTSKLIQIQEGGQS